MFQMSPYQSWMTFIVIVLFVLAVIWLMRQLFRRAEWDRVERTVQRRRAQMAVVTDFPATAHERHLTLVTDISRGAPEPALYDWQKQGI